MRRIFVLFLMTAALFVIVAAGPLPAQSPAAAQAGNPYTVVWADRDNGLYHCPGTRYFGKTRNGMYLYQYQAQQARYRPAYGWVCR
jgi:hypothetical protein